MSRGMPLLASRKSATYTALRVAQESEGWSAACIVDV
jgi:SHS2 domain-containing protein